MSACASPETGEAMLDTATPADYRTSSVIVLAFQGNPDRYLHQSLNLQLLNSPHHEALGLGHIPHSQHPGFNGCLPAYRPTELFSKPQLPLKACL